MGFHETGGGACPSPSVDKLGEKCRTQVLLQVCPVTLGGGRPLLPRRLRLQRRNVERDGQFTALLFDVVGPEPIAEHGHASGLLGAMDEAQSTRR